MIAYLRNWWRWRHLRRQVRAWNRERLVLEVRNRRRR